MDVAGRYPWVHFWDWEDPRLLTIEAKLIEEESGTTSGCRTRSEEVVHMVFIQVFN